MLFTGLQFASEALKSLILTMGVSKMHLTTEQGLRLSRLELDFQVKHLFIYIVVKRFLVIFT